MKRKKSYLERRRRKSAWARLVVVVGMISLIMLAFTVSADAQESFEVDLERSQPTIVESKQRCSGYFGSKSLSQYFGANGASFFDEPVRQSFLTVTCGSWNFDLWNSSDFDLDFDEDNFGHETDLTIFWTKVFGRWDVLLGFSVFYLADQAGGDILRPYGEVGRTFKVSPRYGIRPFLGFDVYESTTSTGPTAGQAYHLGLSHSIRITDRLSFGGKTKAFYDTGGFDFESGFVWMFEGGLTWVVNDRLTINLPTGKAGAGWTVDDRPFDFSIGFGFGVVLW